MKNRFLITAVFILSLAGRSYAEDQSDDVSSPKSSYKVLGRGLKNRKTEESLQLACVGEAKEGTTDELNCHTLQFLLTDAGGEQRLIGAQMILAEGDELTRKAILRELRAQGLAAPKGLARSFQAAKIFYGDGGGNKGIPAVWLMVGTMGGVAASSALFTGGIAAFTLPVIAGAGVFLCIPLITDLIRLPFQVRKARREFGYLFGKMGPGVTVSALDDRSKFSWQIKPKVVDAAGFDRFVAALGGAHRRRARK